MPGPVSTPPLSPLHISYPFTFPEQQFQRPRLRDEIRSCFIHKRPSAILVRRSSVADIVTQDESGESGAEDHEREGFADAVVCAERERSVGASLFDHFGRGIPSLGSECLSVLVDFLACRYRRRITDIGQSVK